MSRPKRFELSESDIEFIRAFMTEATAGGKGVKAADVFSAMRERLPSNVARTHFGPVLSGVVSGFGGFRSAGRNGYVRTTNFVGGDEELISVEEETEAEHLAESLPDDWAATALRSEAEAKAEPEPAPEKKNRSYRRPPVDDFPCRDWRTVERLAVEIEGTRYEIPMAHCDVRDLILRVMKGRRAEHGPIEYCGERFDCDHVDILKRLLLCFFESRIVITNAAA